MKNLDGFMSEDVTYQGHVAWQHEYLGRVQKHEISRECESVA